MNINPGVSPSTYDPQKNTFIKKPENKICAACGQPIQDDVKPMSNYMNSYIANTPNAKAMIINSNEDSLVIGGVTVYKQGSKALQDAIKAERLATTVTPANTLPTAKTTTAPVTTNVGGNPTTVTPSVQASVPNAASGNVNSPNTTNTNVEQPAKPVVANGATVNPVV